MGEQTKADVVSMRVGDGETVDIEELRLGAIYTLNHGLETPRPDFYCGPTSSMVFVVRGQL